MMEATLAQGAFYLTAQPFRYFRATFVGGHKVYLYLIKPYFLKQETYETGEAFINDCLPFKVSGYPVAYLRFFGVVVPVVHAYTAYDLLFIKDTKRNAFLRIYLLQGALYELL